MPLLDLGGRTAFVEDRGEGPAVLMLPGMGARYHTWMHQAEALREHGYRVVAMDNRGAGPGAPVPERLCLDDLVADVRAVVGQLFDGPFRVVGTSLGAFVLQEFLLSEPQVVQAVLAASRARPDAFTRACGQAERSLAASGLMLPPAYEAVVRASQYLGSGTLEDDAAMAKWLDLFEMAAMAELAHPHWAQQHVELDTDRRKDYQRISCDTLVIAFGDDRVAPPSRGAELAATVQRGRLVTIPSAGHLGHLERPREVTAEIVAFFAGYPD
ncbi:alpha/beta fold hydrolase [Streptomyces tendae]|uniref:alpha/beta fold hydrolase n=1 Tax=Streptomyces tendae TaxID=1932 RepID=UPI003685BA5B